MISKFNRIGQFLIVLLLVATILVGCGQAASTSTPAEPVAVATDTPGPVAAIDTPAAEAAATEAPVEEAVATEAPAEEAAAAASRTYVIDATQSQARYNIYEVLMGSPKTVEGVSTGIEGSVTLDSSDLSTATISEIKIDARAFTTDSNMRDGTVRRAVLNSNSDAYRYITFTPTEISGLPATAAVGDAISFQVTGELKIQDAVKPVTFAMTVTATSDAELAVSGTTTILRSDFGLTIPSVPSVANVADEVPLFIDFVATAQ